MIVTISGTPGSGKTTVGKAIAKKLGYKYYSIGALRRTMAVERGMTLQQLNVLGEKQPFTDREVDKWQRMLGQTKNNLVVEGRTSFYFIPHSIKLFLKVDMLAAAKRTLHDFAHVRRFEASKHYTTPQQLAHGFRQRIASDNRRYKKYYGLDIFRPSHYDLIVDTTKKSPSQVLNLILHFIANNKDKFVSRDNAGISRQLSTGIGKGKKKVPKKKISANPVRGKT